MLLGIEFQTLTPLYLMDFFDFLTASVGFRWW